MNELTNYINNPNSDLNNFNLAIAYDAIKHYSPASSFYLRCAEKTSDIDLRYECLLRIYLCFKNLGSRDHTCDSLLKQAICLCPNKPEAYLLLAQYCESKQDWLNMYVYSCLGLQFGKEVSKFLSDIQFPGEYSLILCKAVASLKFGKPDQARKLAQDLLDQYLPNMNEEYKNLLEKHLLNAGGGPEGIAIKKYTNKLKNKLRFFFDGIENIEHNFSQVYQDMFVLIALNGKMNGSYLEIGASDPYKNNNTALLENKFAWRGIGIELNEDLVKTYRKHRHNPVICSDALIIDYSKLLSRYFPNQTDIDYLQLDIDPPYNTYQVLLSIPFDKYKFAVITYEHDHYLDITRSYREKSREYLTNLGYKLVVPDVSAHGKFSFEDWWIHPELISAKIINTIECHNKDINPIESYFLLNN